jgi:hypothetical protein
MFTRTNVVKYVNTVNVIACLCGQMFSFTQAIFLTVIVNLSLLIVRNKVLSRPHDLKAFALFLYTHLCRLIETAYSIQVQRICIENLTRERIAHRSKTYFQRKRSYEFTIVTCEKRTEKSRTNCQRAQR